MIAWSRYQFELCMHYVRYYSPRGKAWGWDPLKIHTITELPVSVYYLNYVVLVLLHFQDWLITLSVCDDDEPTDTTNMIWDIDWKNLTEIVEISHILAMVYGALKVIPLHTIKTAVFLENVRTTLNVCPLFAQGKITVKKTHPLIDPLWTIADWITDELYEIKRIYM